MRSAAARARLMGGRTPRRTARRRRRRSRRCSERRMSGGRRYAPRGSRPACCRPTRPRRRRRRRARPNRPRLAREGAAALRPPRPPQPLAAARRHFIWGRPSCSTKMACSWRGRSRRRRLHRRSLVVVVLLLAVVVVGVSTIGRRAPIRRQPKARLLLPRGTHSHRLNNPCKWRRQLLRQSTRSRPSSPIALAQVMVAAAAWSRLLLTTTVAATHRTRPSTPPYRPTIARRACRRAL